MTLDELSTEIMRSSSIGLEGDTDSSFLGILGVTWGWDPVPRYQLVGKHFRDEETIAAAKTIDSILKA